MSSPQWLNLKWLDTYSGESTDQLLAFESEYRIDSLLLAFEQAIYGKLAREGSEALTEEERTVLAIEALEREVNNGGYSQFFINSSSEYIPIIVGALSRIGCPATAALTEKAIKALGPIVLTPEAIENAIMSESQERDRMLEQCDQIYFDSREPIAERLFAFIKANKNQISL